MFLKMKFLAFIALYCSETIYDYIVIGGGSAGGVVAYELSKKGKTLLIEAGPIHYNKNISTPILNGAASEDPNISFEYFVKYNADRPKVFYPRVGALGGCSLHNGMISVYPNDLDFNNLVKHTENLMFSETEMRKVFIEMEENNYPLLSSSKDHGTKGWYPISYINFFRQLTLDPKLLSFMLFNKPNPLHDVNGKIAGVLGADKKGNILIPINVNKNYERGNYLDHILSAQTKYGLDIWPDTLVTRILLNKENNRAEGVQFKKGKYLYKASPLNIKSARFGEDGIVYANKEVILSAGAFNTPQILMLSGIGPKEELEKLGIKSNINLKGVGKNLQDRYEISLVNKFREKFSLLKDCKLKADSNQDPCYKQYEKYRTGPYISNGVLSANVDKSSESAIANDLLTINIPSLFNGYFKGYSRVLAENFDSISQTIVKSRTKNKSGTVKLRSSDPTDTPIIDFNQFGDDPSGNNADLLALVKKLKNLRELFSKILIPYTETKPGFQANTDEKLKQYVKDYAWGHHACCTAKIGKLNHDGVLDQNFKVRGVSNLRVMDMSIFPEIPGFFPVVYLQMICIQVAKLIISQN